MRVLESFKRLLRELYGALGVIRVSRVFEVMQNETSYNAKAAKNTIMIFIECEYKIVIEEM